MATLSLTLNHEIDGLLAPAAQLAKNGARRLNQILAQVAMIKPRDSIEAHLALQMTEISEATIRVASAEPMFVDQMGATVNATTKLARTYVMQS